MMDAHQPKPLWRRIFEFPLVAMLVALAVFVGVFGILTFALSKLPLGAPDWAVQVFNGLLAAAIAIVLAKFVIARLGAAPRDDLAWPGAGRQLLAGTLGAALLMSGIVAIAALLGGYTIAGWGGSTSWPMIVFLGGVQAAVVEEVIFRGILFRFLEDFGGSWFALAATSALFGLAHISNDNATWFSSLAIAVEAGVLLGAAYMLARSLWLPIGIHFGWNVTQGYVWDVPVSGHAVDGLVESHPAGAELISGGAFGLEASAVALVLATAAGLWLLFRALRAGHLVQPWWVRRRLARAEIAAV
jgi:membrane protease YdiL (CAAX protease family)